MNLAVVQKEVEGWAPEKQDRLAGYLAVLRLKRSPAHAEELGRRLDDKSPENWLSLQQLREKLQKGSKSS